MRCLPVFVVIFFLVSSSPSALANEKWINRETRESIQDGIRFILAQQDLDKRSTYYGAFVKTPTDREYSIAITSFACLALIASGNLPNRGEHGHRVALGVRFILRHVNPNGYIAREGDGSRMHGHGFAALLLAQVCGVGGDTPFTREVHKKLKKSIKLSIRAQTPDGGWGYVYNDKTHEGSITVCQLQALRASRNVGIHVPKEVIERALDYLRRSANPDGSFKYRLGMPAGRKSFPLTAAAVSSLNATGDYESKEVVKGLNFMRPYMPRQRNSKTDSLYQAFYYYGHFYAAQAMFQSGPSDWNQWYPAVRDDLNRRKSKLGHWGRAGTLGGSRYGETYATSIAVLILQIPYNYLPIFQR